MANPYLIHLQANVLKLKAESTSIAELRAAVNEEMRQERCVGNKINMFSKKSAHQCASDHSSANS